MKRVQIVRGFVVLVLIVAAPLVRAGAPSESSMSRPTSGSSQAEGGQSASEKATGSGTTPGSSPAEGDQRPPEKASGSGPTPGSDGTGSGSPAAADSGGGPASSSADSSGSGTGNNPLATARATASRLSIENLFVLRLSPVGFEDQARLVLRHALFESLPPQLFALANVNAALNLKINPAYMKIGPSIDLQPINLFRLRVGYEYVRYFGAFGFPRSYPASTWDFLADLKEDVDPSSGYETSGHHVYLEPNLFLAYKRIIATAKLGFEYWDVALADGDTVQFDPQVNTLVPATGWVMAGDFNVLRIGPPVTVGLNYSVVKSYYPNPVSVETGPGTRHRLGPLVAYMFSTRPEARISRPTVALLTGYYLGDMPEGSSRIFAVLVFSINFSLLR